MPNADHDTERDTSQAGNRETTPKTRPDGRSTSATKLLLLIPSAFLAVLALLDAANKIVNLGRGWLLVVLAVIPATVVAQRVAVLGKSDALLRDARSLVGIALTSGLILGAVILAQHAPPIPKFEGLVKDGNANKLYEWLGDRVGQKVDLDFSIQLPLLGGEGGDAQAQLDAIVNPAPTQSRDISVRYDTVDGRQPGAVQVVLHFEGAAPGVPTHFFRGYGTNFERPTVQLRGSFNVVDLRTSQEDTFSVDLLPV